MEEGREGVEADTKYENVSTEHKKHEQETRSQSFGSQMGPKPHLSAANNVPVKDVGKKNREMQRENNKKNKRNRKTRKGETEKIEHKRRWKITMITTVARKSLSNR